MDLFADYLAFRRGHPVNGIKPSRSTAYPFYLCGGSLPTGLAYHAKAAIPYWDAYISADQAFATWMRSPKAFVAPEAWTFDVPFPHFLTPYVFARDFLPPRWPRNGPSKWGSSRHRGQLFGIEVGLHELSAFAHGWPLTPPEKALAVQAAYDLTLTIPYTLYAVSDGSYLPPRLDDTQDYLQRAEVAYRVGHNPLTLSNHQPSRYLPQWLIEGGNTRERLIDLLPPRTEVAGSHKTPHALDKPRLDKRPTPG